MCAASVEHFEAIAPAVETLFDTNATEQPLSRRVDAGVSDVRPGAMPRALILLSTLRPFQYLMHRGRARIVIDNALG